MTPRQFTVYLCDLEPTFGHQIKKTRPCVVVSPDSMNELTGTVVVVPMTSTVRSWPFHVAVNYKNRPGALACDQIKVIDKRRVGRIFAALTTADIRSLSNVLCQMFEKPNTLS